MRYCTLRPAAQTGSHALRELRRAGGIRNAERRAGDCGSAGFDCAASSVGGCPPKTK